MTSHLLDLRALHISAPGVLDVIFGPDGPCDFWSAPVWGSIARNDDRGRTPADYYWVGDVVGGHVRTYDPRAHVDGDHGSLIIDAALDCRVPSVAARLAGLCARAMDPEATGQAWATEAGEMRPDYWVLRYCDTAGHVASAAWAKTTGSPNWRALSPCPPAAPDLPADLPDVASFIAALVMALAKRIAALGEGATSSPE